MMLKKLELKNFQSHEHSELVFSPGVNVVAGRSDSGKSAIVRALRWIVFNRPSGEGFRSHWGGETRVTVSASSGEISRQRTASKNAYFIDGERYGAVGTTVPEEVETCSALGPVNFQFQMDPPFLVSETAGGVARHFNVVANLDQIDTGTANVNRVEGRLRNEIESYEDEVKRLNDELEIYEDVEVFERRLASLEITDSTRYLAASTLSLLENLLTEFEQVELEISRFRPFLNLSKDLMEVVVLIEIAEDLENASSRIVSVESKIKEMQGWSELVEPINQTAAHISEASTLELYGPMIERLDGEITALETEAREIREKFENEVSGYCPLCGRGDNGES